MYHNIEAREFSGDVVGLENREITLFVDARAVSAHTSHIRPIGPPVPDEGETSGVNPVSESRVEGTSVWVRRAEVWVRIAIAAVSGLIQGSNALPAINTLAIDAMNNGNRIQVEAQDANLSVAEYCVDVPPGQEPFFVEKLPNTNVRTEPNTSADIITTAPLRNEDSGVVVMVPEGQWSRIIALGAGFETADSADDGLTALPTGVDTAYIRNDVIGSERAFACDALAAQNYELPPYGYNFAAQSDGGGDNSTVEEQVTPPPAGTVEAANLVPQLELTPEQRVSAQESLLRAYENGYLDMRVSYMTQGYEIRNIAVILASTDYITTPFEVHDQNNALLFRSLLAINAITLDRNNNIEELVIPMLVETGGQFFVLGSGPISVENLERLGIETEEDMIETVTTFLNSDMGFEVGRSITLQVPDAYTRARLLEVETNGNTPRGRLFAVTGQFLTAFANEAEILYQDGTNTYPNDVFVPFNIDLYDRGSVVRHVNLSL